MPSISYDGLAAWSNYHLTRGDDPKATFPAMIIEELGHVHAGDLDAAGLARFGAFADRLLAHVQHQKERSASHTDGPFAAGLVGQAWSFAPLIGTSTGQLVCNGMAGIAGAAKDDLHRRCKIGRRRVGFALGGTRLREIATWAEARGLSIATSGTHLGPTIAGGFGTASHGSKLGYGGLQNMVMGMHLVTGEDRHVWIEPKSRPALSDAGIARLTAGDVPVRAIRDDDAFADALIHLGAMGIVCGVALELEPIRRFAKRVVEDPLSLERLEAIARGDHNAVARELGCKVAPVFHEVTIDPHDPFGKSCLHTMYFPTKAKHSSGAPLDYVSPADAIVRYAKGLSEGSLREYLLGELTLAFEGKAKPGGDPDPGDLQRAVATVLQGANSAYAAYRHELEKSGSLEQPGPFDPDGKDVNKNTWSEIHNSDVITGGIPGALYNASFAIPRERTADAVAAICEAVANARLPGVFVFTLRFVSDPRGTLRFTRFDETTVIEIDGISALACNLAIAHVMKHAPGDKLLIMALESLKPTLANGAHTVRAALDGGKIDHSLHWAKLGDLDKAKVWSDFGERIVRWQKTREALLSDFGQSAFRNAAVEAYGLLDPPPAP